MPPVAPASRVEPKAAPVPPVSVTVTPAPDADPVPGWEALDDAASAQVASVSAPVPAPDVLRPAADAPAFAQTVSPPSSLAYPPPRPGPAPQPGIVTEGAQMPLAPPTAPQELTVQFTRFYRGYQTGQQAGFLADVAHRLVMSGIAVWPSGFARGLSASGVVRK